MKLFKTINGVKRPVPTTRQPSIKTLEKWNDAGYCKATDGCKTEPDGTCPHGHISWLVYLNLI